jgi:hypothetical protein
MQKDRKLRRKGLVKSNICVLQERGKHFGSGVGCPRNNQTFFRFEPKQTETQSVSVVFRFVSGNQKTFFWFVSVFRTSIETTETNRTLSKQTEKISKKPFLLGGPRNS